MLLRIYVQRNYSLLMFSVIVFRIVNSAYHTLFKFMNLYIFNLYIKIYH